MESFLTAALTLARTLERDHADNPHVQHLLGRLSWQSGARRDAIRHLRKARDLSPKNEFYRDDLIKYRWRRAFWPFGS